MEVMVKESRELYPLSSLKIGDVQSYLSKSFLYFAAESNKFFIIVDNRPWSTNKALGPKHLWQFLVAKYQLSPFANSRRRDFCSTSTSPTTEPVDIYEMKKLIRWSPVIDSVKWREKSMYPLVELSKTLHGLIIFEVAWKDVCGINYLNELQTDTSLALEIKSMRKWEFDTPEHALEDISSWFSGTESEMSSFISNVNTMVHPEDRWYAKSSDTRSQGSSILQKSEDVISKAMGRRDSCCQMEIDTSESAEDDYSFEEHQDPPTGCRLCGSVEASYKTSQSSDEYEQTVLDSYDAIEQGSTLVQFRFRDRDLPFKLNDIITSNIRLLTLLELGLPSWVIFLQSYPVLRKLYRPWMKQLARTIYVIVSLVTVLIAFYDLYKNVPVFKSTAALVFNPLFDWIDSWDMISRVKCLATMFFLNHLGKAIEWTSSVLQYVKPLLTLVTKPMMGPLVQMAEFFSPLWRLLIETTEFSVSFFWMIIEATYLTTISIIEAFLWPARLLLSIISSFVISLVCPIFCLFWEVFVAPIRLFLVLVAFAKLLVLNIFEFLKDVWQLTAGIFQFTSASVSEVKSAGAYDVIKWKALWDDLFSQIFRAVRCIINGFITFFASCNRHRLSIYNHIQRFYGQLSQLLRLAPCCQYWKGKEYGQRQEEEFSHSMKGLQNESVLSKLKSS